MAFAWRNPIGDLGPLPPHPIAESELSSAVSDYLTFDDAHEDFDKILDLFDETSMDDLRSTVLLLRIFHKHLPKEGKMALMSEVIAIGSNNDDKLRALATHIREAILKPMKVSGGNQPQALISPSTHPEAAAAIALSVTQIESSSRARQAELKRACLRRDGYKCAYSWHYDYDSAKKNPNVPSNTHAVDTECAHILPFALSKFDDRNAVETQNKATIWWSLHRYFPGLKDRIHAGSINQESNAITLGCAIHKHFGQYRVGFWPTEKEHVYKINWFERLRAPDPRAPELPDSQIVLRPSDPNVPMPSPEYFKVHYRIAEMLHVSGIGREVEQELEAAALDPENMRPDGSTDIASIIRRRMLIST